MLSGTFLFTYNLPSDSSGAVNILGYFKGTSTLSAAPVTCQVDKKGTPEKSVRGEDGIHRGSWGLQGSCLQEGGRRGKISPEKI